MKRIILGLVTAGMLAACGQSKTNQTAAAASPYPPGASSAVIPKTNVASVPVNPNAPVMKFEEEAFNFGKIKQGDSVMHKFKFANTGKTPLIITDAVASCGCTKPEWPKEPVQPGDKGEIKVTFHSVGKSGLQDKMITITGNTTPAQSAVHLLGEVIVPK